MLCSKQKAVLAASWLATAGLLCSLCASEAGAATPAAAGEAAPSADRLPVTLAPLLAKVLPAVVSIRVIGQRYLVTELKPGAPAPEPKTQPFKSGGSGIIFEAEQGLIATNHHVIKDAVAISVGLHDGRSARATLVGLDIGTDIAILKIDLSGLAALKLGNSDTVKIGDFVIAVGNPYGLEGTATAGIVSGLMRSEVGYELFESFIQTDAAVNPGNSGGALVNLQGDLIGINTAIAGGGSNIGIGFAIPINMARRIGKQILIHGRMPRGSVGLTTEDISPDAAQALRRNRGALITRVAPNSPAQGAGLGIGHAVVGINGELVRTNADYMARLGSSAIGDVLEFEVASENATRKVSLSVADLKIEPATVVVPDDFRSIGGMVVASISPGSPHYGEMRGAVIQNVTAGGLAHNAGLRAGDVIIEVNQRAISDVGQISDLIEDAAGISRVKISRQRVPFLVQFSR